MTPALAVQPWPGPVPSAPDGLCVIGIKTTSLRSVQRANIRRAAREVLAALTGEPASCFGFYSPSGGPLNVIVGGHDSDIGCSFSHEDGYSLAAIHLGGVIGVDLMRVQDIPDWQAVARDYVGPAVTAHLQATPAAERPLAFALAWTRREAELKCLGSQLTEWRATDDTSVVTAIPLIMEAAGLVGHIAIHQGGSE
jgi:4'-phosphopantetheinyl transferase